MKKFAFLALLLGFAVTVGCKPAEKKPAAPEGAPTTPAPDTTPPAENK